MILKKMAFLNLAVGLSFKFKDLRLNLKICGLLNGVKFIWAHAYFAQILL